MNNYRYPNHASNYQVPKRVIIVVQPQKRARLFNESAVYLQAAKRPLFKLHLFLCTSATTAFAPALQGHTVSELLFRSLNLTL